MGEPKDLGALTVTFDTNTLDAVVWPATAQRGAGTDGAIVRAAIQAGRIRGFFCETIVTVEGIKKGDRWDILGKTRVFSEASSRACQRGASVSFQLGVGMNHVRPSLDSRASARVRAAIELSICPLRTAARFGEYHLDPEVYPLFEPAGGMLELLRCMDHVNSMSTEVERRGLGRAAAVELGKHFSKRDGIGQPELWLQGLGRARGKSERKRVAQATREWADGDNIAAHYGFGIELFCSDDFGKAAPSRSVLSYGNRKWLTNEFSVNFVTLSELAQRVA